MFIEDAVKIELKTSIAAVLLNRKEHQCYPQTIFTLHLDHL